MKISRREFLKMGAAAGAGAVFLRGAPAAPNFSDAAKAKGDSSAPSIGLRDFGATKFRSSILGFGGAPVGALPDRETALATIRRALEAGINYLDTASQYGHGESERRLGAVLRESAPDGNPWRRKIWLSTKTLQREYDRSREEFEGSLRRLGVDHVDTLQIHAVNQEADYRVIFGGAGSLKAAVEAKRDGRAKHVGITGHRDPALLLRAFKEYDFESVLIPLGPPDKHLNDFTSVLEEARRRKMAVIGMKVFSEGRAVGALDLERCLRYVLELPVSTAIVGFSVPAHVDFAANIARRFKPLSPNEEKELLAAARSLADPRILWWKG